MNERVAKSVRVVVGMEIHVQLATASKMFTAVANGAHMASGVFEPNSLVDAQIIGLPGVLPVMNKTAVEFSIIAGLALGCKIARHTKWDRKSYFYPDLPKNYQISQYDLPLCYDGNFEGIRIRRAHLEEDAGKLLHEAPGGFRIDHSIVDLNRAGTPLLEIVTEPDFSNARQVAQFGQSLQKLVQFLGISHGQMQMGHMRFEPNINLHIVDETGTMHQTAITEIKNLNSFSVLERATDYEVGRQLRAWQATGTLGRKSTMGWDESTSSTFLQREKEEAQDYRYFPDPDLPPVEVSDEWLAELQSRVGEMPAVRIKRYVDDLKLSAKDAEQLAADRKLGDYFELALKFEPKAKRIADLILNPLAQLAKSRGCAPHELAAIDPPTLAQIATLIEAGKIPAAKAIDVFTIVDQNGGLREDDLRAAGLFVSSDTSAIDAAIDAMIASNPPALADVRAGKKAAMGALVGLVMRQAKGLNPKIVQQRLAERIESN